MIAAHPDRFLDPGTPLQTTRWARRHHSGILAPVIAMWPFRKRKDPEPAPLDSGPELHLVVIDTIQQVPGQIQRCVVLKAPDNGQYLPVWIGPSEADLLLPNTYFPMVPGSNTYDVILDIIRQVGATVKIVVINAVVDTVYHSEIMLQRGDDFPVLDARPCDALALAVRTGAPIYVADAVMKAAGFPVEPRSG